MFMSCLMVLDMDQKVTATSCKSSILEFRYIQISPKMLPLNSSFWRSSLLRVMETIMFSPFLLLGTTTQRQWVNINYFADFIDDPLAPASQIVVELQSRHIQVIA